MQGSLLKFGVKLDLVDGWPSLGLGLEPLQVLDPKVRDSYRAGAAFGVNLFKGPPGLYKVLRGRNRPVDQVEINIVTAKPLPAASKALRVESKPCSRFQSLVVMKTSSRPSPEPASAAPTPPSLR